MHSFIEKNNFFQSVVAVVVEGVHQTQHGMIHGHQIMENALGEDSWWCGGGLLFLPVVFAADAAPSTPLHKQRQDNLGLAKENTTTVQYKSTTKVDFYFFYKIMRNQG